MEITGRDEASRRLIRTLVLATLSIGPTVFGTLVELSGYQGAWAVMTALAVAAVILRSAANRLPAPVRDLRPAPA